ncbi:MAG: type II toxin-antitoxin system RelE/ParE family toxin [Deltaproteobacteria bacterium]|nr:type II toxin-antitoxin system RelE/ParE family toxin [Deltaproteobacteria bacterium]
MTQPVRILRRAQTDLLEIQAYIARDNPAAAEGLVNAILDLLHSLGTLPDRSAIPKDAHLQQAGYRYMQHGEYLIFYKVLRSQVRVYRILHGRRLYKDLL